MKAFIAFTKKEFMENLRTHRLVILAAAFILLGIMSPLLAKLLPELLGGMDMGGGVILNLPESTAMDSWAQFFKNVGQMGMLALIITFCGIMGSEFGRGTLVNLLTKGLRRRTVILSKFLSASVLWLGSYLLCLAVCYAYTAYYWPAAGLTHAFPAFLAPWMFGEFIIALLIIGGTVFKNTYGSLLTCGGVIVILNLLNIIPKAQRYNPIILSGDTLYLLDAQKGMEDFIPAAAICAVATILLVTASVAIFNKKQI